MLCPVLFLQAVTLSLPRETSYLLFLPVLPWFSFQSVGKITNISSKPPTPKPSDHMEFTLHPQTEHWIVCQILPMFAITISHDCLSLLSLAVPSLSFSGSLPWPFLLTKAVFWCKQFRSLNHNGILPAFRSGRESSVCVPSRWRVSMWTRRSGWREHTNHTEKEKGWLWDTASRRWLCYYSFCWQYGWHEEPLLVSRGAVERFGFFSEAPWREMVDRQEFHRQWLQY